MDRKFERMVLWDNTSNESNIGNGHFWLSIHLAAASQCSLVNNVGCQTCPVFEQYMVFLIIGKAMKGMSGSYAQCRVSCGHMPFRFQTLSLSLVHSLVLSVFWMINSSIDDWMVQVGTCIVFVTQKSLYKTYEKVVLVLKSEACCYPRAPWWLG